MLYCRALLRHSRSTIPLRTAVEFARATGGLHDDKCGEGGAAALMTFSSSLSPCIPFAEQEERECTRNMNELHSSIWHDEQLEIVNVNTALFTCADPLQHDDRLHSVHKRVNNTCLPQEEKKNVTMRGVSSLYNDTDATLWERYVEMYQEEIYNEVHRSSDAEIAASPEMTNQIVIEGVVNSVCAGYRPHHAVETQTSDNVSDNIMENKDYSSIRKKSSLSSSLTSSSTEASIEAGAVRKVVNVLNPHRVNALLVQVWLYCNDDESANSTIAPLAVCSYVTLDALNAMYGSDKEANQRIHYESRKSSLLSGKAEMTTEQRRNDTKNFTCSKEEIANMVHELVAELEEVLLFQSVVVRGCLKMEMFFDGDVNRIVQVPIVWLPDNAIKSGVYLLPVTQKRAQYVQQLKKLE